METTLALTNEQERAIKQLVGYKGRKPVRYRKLYKGMSLASYWCDGSRDYYYYIDITNAPKLVSAVPQNGTPFDKCGNLTADNLSPNVILVSASIMQGRPLPVVVYC
ncbi:MAG: hypothetical protein ACK5S6_00810 [bacterium]|jgi:hypothetical protein